MSDLPRVWSMEELVAAEFPSVSKQLEKELWVFDPEWLTLDIRGDGGYEIGLERLTTSARVADLIFQVSHKTWASDALIASLVRVLDLLLDPQHYLCSWGKERGPINAKAVIGRQLAG